MNKCDERIKKISENNVKTYGKIASCGYLYINDVNKVLKEIARLKEEIISEVTSDSKDSFVPITLNLHELGDAYILKGLIVLKMV